MANNSVGLNTITLRGKPGDGRLLKRVDAVAEAGFSGIGLWMKDIEWWLDSGRALSELRDRIEHKGLTVDEICAVSVCDEHGRVQDATEAFRRAAMLNAGAIVCVYHNPKAPIEHARKQWAEFLEPIQNMGVKAAFEFIGTWEQYSTIEDAYAVVQDSPQVGTITLDTFHFWRGRSKVDTIKRIPVERIALVHLNDVKRVEWSQATDQDRTYPGEGVMPLTQILGTLIGEGYTGPLSVEIFGECQRQDPREVAVKAFKSASKVVKAL